MLILHDMIPLHWGMGGLLLGGITLLLLAFTGHALGISTGFENLCSLGSRLPYFQRGALQGPGMWRLPFLVGLVLGGFFSSYFSGGWQPFWELGMFDAVIGAGPLGKLIWMFVGGLFIGFGTRLAGGCTSGHGIFGVANWERASLISTIVFMLFGILTTQLIYGVLFS